MTRIRRTATLAALCAAGLLALPAGAAGPPVPTKSTYGATKGFSLLGSTTLGDRGVNSPLAVAGRCAYVGDRYDKNGIAIVNVANPRKPRQVGVIPPVAAATQRELRADVGLGLLVVMNYALTTGGAGNNVKLYDIATDCTKPTLLSTYDMGRRSPHEFFLWKDAKRPGRALVYLANTLFSPDLEVVDITDPKAPRLAAVYDLGIDATDQTADVLESGSGYLHSLSVSDDGTRAYMGTWDYGFYVADTSALAEPALSGTSLPLIRPLSAGRADYGGNVHGAVRVPGRPFAVMVEEAYANAGKGCPFGTMRMADVSDEANPKTISEFKLQENDCDKAKAVNGTFTSHNQTVFPNVVLMGWYAGGLRAVDISNPAAPVESGAFVPKPTFEPGRRDTRLFFPRSDVPQWTGAMWSYPVVQDGLVYVVDIDLGLYILSYTGRHAKEVRQAGFVEGNSSPSRYTKATPRITRPAAVAAGPATVVRSPYADLPLPARALQKPYGFFCVGA
ncbi:MAG TPA: hypothetical protein VNB94_08940 [Mycobacteriales bacterium]|nr:hypothetical protein [Mycobacteriales bacterium]